MNAFLTPKDLIARFNIQRDRYIPAIALLMGLLLFPTSAAAGQSACEDLPLPARVVLSKVNPLLVEKAYDQAIETLQKFQARGKSVPKPGEPDSKGYHHPEIYYTLGNCYLLQEKYEPAAAAFRKAVERDDTHTYAWLNLGKSYYEMEKFAQAGHAFGKGYATAEEKNPEHLYFSAAAYLMAEKYLRSIEIFQALLAAHPAAIKPEWREHLVHALLSADQGHKALPHIRRLIAASTGKKQIQWQEILLHQYVQLNMPKAALDYARKLARNAPTVAKWWKALAHIQLNESDYEAALVSLTIYSFLTPLSLEEKKLLADLNLQLGIPVKAAPAYEACLEKKTEKEVLQHLIVAYRQLGKIQTAIDCLDRFDAAANDPELMLQKGELLYALKKYDQAAAVYRKAARKKGKHTGRAWLMAGYAAWQINDISASKAAFARAADYKKEKKAATTALKQLASVTAQSAVNDQQQKRAANDPSPRSKI